jgi:nitrogen fixation protein
MMHLLRKFSCLLRLFYGSGVLFLGWGAVATDGIYDSGIVGTAGVIGLRAEAVSTNIILTWPSDPQESFVVLWRSNADYQVPCVVLTNQLRAASTGNETVFIDVGGLTRLQEGMARTNLTRLYVVYVIPDFWFDMQGVTLCGGPEIPSEDFLPFYYDTGGMSFPQQNVSLIVDGKDSNWGPIHVERVNFGTVQEPRWIYTWGFWFRIDFLTNGAHTLQLRSMISLNNTLGPWTQDIFLTNQPVLVWISVNGERTNHYSWWDQRLGHNFPVPRTTDEYGEKFIQDERNLPSVKIPSRPFGLKSAETNTKPSGMVLDLGETSHYVKITPAYSQAALEAVLPYFSDAAKKLDLPLPLPITKTDVAGFHVLPIRELAASMLLKNGWVLNFGFGYVGDFSSPHSYFNLQDPDKIPEYYGKVKMGQDEAVQLARDTLKKLSIHLEDVFADQNPQVVPPVKIGTNTVPRYGITWFDPFGGTAADFEVNAQTKQIERMYLRSWNLRRPSPKINVVPVSDPDWPSVNPEYARQLIPMMLKAIDDYAQKLSLPIPRPLTTNNVARVEIHDNGGWPHCEIILTNGWRFTYRHCMVNGNYAPDVFVTTDNHPFHLKEFEGKWNLTTNQAIKLVKTTLAKLDFPTNNIHMDFAPNIIYPAGDFRKIIPRYFFEWNYENAAHDDLQSKVEAEVNADNGELESLYYDDKAYWDCRPPIDVPISLPVPKQTNAFIPTPPKTFPKLQPRPFTAFKPPENK